VKDDVQIKRRRRSSKIEGKKEIFFAWKEEKKGSIGGRGPGEKPKRGKAILHLPFFLGGKGEELIPLGFINGREVNTVNIPYLEGKKGGGESFPYCIGGGSRP